jgi:hypothetical protein
VPLHHLFQRAGRQGPCIVPYLIERWQMTTHAGVSAGLQLWCSRSTNALSFILWHPEFWIVELC